MFVTRAAAVLALLGAAPAAAGNLRHLGAKNENGAKVKPAGPKPDDNDYTGTLCATVFGAIAGALSVDPDGDILGEFGFTVDQYVVNKKGKGKYTCQGQGLGYEAMAELLGIDDPQGPLKLSGLALAAADEPVEIPCNPGDDANAGDPESYNWRIQITPSGNVAMQCKFQLEV